MMIGVILAWCENFAKPFRCMQSYILLPIFVLSMLISIVFSVVFVIGASAGSDFCYPTPDQTIQMLLGTYEEKIGPFVIEVTNYYVRGCKGTNPIDFDGYVNIATDAVDSVHTFIEYLESNVEKINYACGGRAMLIIGIANMIDLALHAFVYVVDVARRLFFCSNINGLYAEVAYNVVCINGVNALYGIFASQLCIAIFSMILVTLRVSWQQLEE